MNCGKILYGPQCFIATAVYSADSPEVAAFRRFRDDVLGLRPAGRLAVRLYYAVSPAVARAVTTFAWMRTAARWLLDRALLHVERGATGRKRR